MRDLVIETAISWIAQENLIVQGITVLQRDLAKFCPQSVTSRIFRELICGGAEHFRKTQRYLHVWVIASTDKGFDQDKLIDV